MNAGPIAITLDLDWACESAIEDTLEYLRSQDIPVTVFATHSSPYVVARLDTMEVGLHPYFDPNSSHGSTLDEVVRQVLQIPHNLPAFRCHRFAVSNPIREVMVSAGMRISSNVCTDLEVVAPFRDRYGLLEIPIFLEDGGYLHQGHPMYVDEHLEMLMHHNVAKVVLIHPMHFAINSPNLGYMNEIKSSVSRAEWNEMPRSRIDALRWKQHGIRDFTIDLIATARQNGIGFTALGRLTRDAPRGNSGQITQTSTRTSRT